MSAKNYEIILCKDGHLYINKQDSVSFRSEDSKRFSESDIAEITKFFEKKPVSEDLEKAAQEYAYQRYDEDCRVYGYVELAFKAGANWQKTKDQSIIELAEDHAMLAGMEKMKEQMMKEAVDGTVFTQLEDGEIMVRSHYFKSEKFNYLDEVKLIIIKEE